MDFDGVVFDLDGDGEGGFYRVRMTNRPREINRQVIIDRGNRFQILAELLDVVHGTATDGGEDATLVIASFSFLPSRERRFKSAQITWTFTSDDPAVDVNVTNIAPAASWSLVPTRRTDETATTGKADLGPSAGPVTASGGVEYSMKQTQDHDFHTTVTGAKRVYERDNGGYDTARWVLEENPAQKTGIIRTLQVGLLLRRTLLHGKPPGPDPAPTFRGTLDVVVEKDWWSEHLSEAKRVWQKNEREDAIIFKPGVDRVSGLFDIDKNSLSSVHLRDDVMYMSLHENFEDLQTEREARKERKQDEKWKGEEDSEQTKNQGPEVGRTE